MVFHCIRTADREIGKQIISFISEYAHLASCSFQSTHIWPAAHFTVHTSGQLFIYKYAHLASSSILQMPVFQYHRANQWFILKLYRAKSRS